jgi:hypothetical protein
MASQNWYDDYIFVIHPFVLTAQSTVYMQRFFRIYKKKKEKKSMEK